MISSSVHCVIGLPIRRNITPGASYSRSRTQADSDEPPVLASNSIAVLPFTDLSPNKNQEYFSDGLTEELLNLLAKVPELRVAARTSCFSFKGQALDITEISQRLRVAHVLEGSVRRSGDRVRISAQLIHAQDGYQMWSHSYDRQMDNIFAIQEEIAAAVVAQLKIKILGVSPTTQHTDPEAYALYLQARHIAHQVTAAAYEKAIGLYRQALEIAPDYAAAWTGLARIYGNQVEKGLRDDEEGHALALGAVTRALDLDPGSAEAYAELAWIAMYLEGNLEEAANYFERALELAPADPEILFDSATLIQDLGRMDEAIAIKEYSVARDPVNPRRHYNLGNAYLFGRHYQSAVSSYRLALALSPELLGAQYHIGRALLLMGEPAAALVEIEAESFDAWRMVGLPAVYHALARYEESEKSLAQLIEKYERDAAFNIAYIQAFRGETDLAFEWLDKAVMYGDPGLSEIAVTPEFESLRDDPRWLPFLDKLDRSPRQLDSIDFQVAVPN